jgi:hypothetical protein
MAVVAVVHLIPLVTRVVRVVVVAEMHLVALRVQQEFIRDLLISVPQDKATMAAQVAKDQTKVVVAVVVQAAMVQTPWH